MRHPQNEGNTDDSKNEQTIADERSDIVVRGELHGVRNDLGCVGEGSRENLSN
jgi:hypothetical protein